MSLLKNSSQHQYVQIQDGIAGELRPVAGDK